MADPWRIAGMTWSLTAIGWLLSPIFVFLVNKFFSYLSVDVSRKLRELEIHTIPALKQTLSRATERKVLKAADDGGSEYDLKILDKLTKDLRSALYEAEDILDLIDYHKIEKEVIRGYQLGAAISAFIGRCRASWFGRRVDSTQQLAQRWYRRIAEMVPENFRGASAPLPISGGATSISGVQRLRGWCRHLDISNYWQSIRSWLANAYTVARSYRDWSYQVVGIEVNKKDGIGLDFSLLTIDGKSLRKRIEDIEHMVTDSKKSHLLLNQQSSSNELSDKDTDKESRSKQKDIDDLDRINERKVFGREKERERICSMLRKGPDASRSSRPYSVVGIYGISGYGKSTLAQYVCDHEKYQEDKHFDPVIFIQVSKTFELDDIIRDMLKQMTQDQPSQDQPSNTKSLCNELKKKLEGRRFLLVLDDLWVNKDNEKERRILLRTLDAGKSGSGILVTAQRKDAVIALGAEKPIKIPKLDADEYFSMFMHYAGKSDDSAYGRIGREIAEKLHKSPLAAETVARRLGMNPDIEFWRTTANLDVLNETIGALWWSYQQLGADIRRCFEYCSTFPRGYKLKPRKLVRMWIAQGFVKTSSNATEDMEDIGQSYIHELRNCSFLKVKRTGVVTIHDMLHELAERVTGSEFFRIDVNGSTKDIPPDVRHLFIETYNRAEITEKILELENLRTLIIEEKYKSNKEKYKGNSMGVEERHDLIKEKVFVGMFKKLRKLRVLRVRVKCNKDIVFSVPESIGQMKHLRYLGFHTTYNSPLVLVLPSILSKLYHMQILEVRKCKLSCAEDLTNLTHLRQIPGNLLPNIGKLTSLQTIPVFRTRKEPAGYELKQLKHLNKLRGILRIKGLETVESKEEALEANVSGKKRITTLELYFGNVAEEKKVVQSQVLEGLCPPNQLEELTIWDYGGNGYPSWMLGGHHSGLNNIHRLELFRCSSQLESIPECSAFFQRLRSFCVFKCGWDALPDHLERLTSLQELVIIVCPNIKVLPTLPQSLKHIRLVDGGDDLERFCKQKWQLKNITTVMDIWL
ncbi:disease resistance protein RGA2-like [Phragmites australis]|uniref:disease resistance protein RGA2-like n=1 Tax=Phragmites australis TaxID=29695 RepID=UPI002D78E3A0|nr:disease resistance protein RGA2-like [Phragmites australis]XP_062198105.1 disease resistance protein RGA2-like [Phragmites australis]